MSTPVPDIAGLISAQQRLYDGFGRDIRFYGHTSYVYDPGIDPNEFDYEGFPLDPLVAGSAQSASAGVGISDLTIVGSAHGNVMFQPLSAIRRDEVSVDDLGMRSLLNKDIIMPLAYLPQASGASHFEVGTFARDSDGNILYNDQPNPDGSYEQQWTADDGEVWAIVNIKVDGAAADRVYRIIVFGQGTR